MNATKYPFTNSTSGPTQQHKKWNIMWVVGVGEDNKYSFKMLQSLSTNFRAILKRK